jgi:chromosome segregation ATPase
MQSSDYNYIKVQGYDNLVKDKRNNSLINVNRKQFEQYKERKLREKELENRVASLEDKLTEALELFDALTKGVESDGDTTN